MSIAELITERSERLHDRLATAKDLLEHLLAVIVGRQLQGLGQLAIKRRQIILIGRGRADLIEEPSANVFDQCPRERDSAGWIGSPTIKRGRPARMDLVRLKPRQGR